MLGLRFYNYIATVNLKYEDQQIISCLKVHEWDSVYREIILKHYNKMGAL